MFNWKLPCSFRGLVDNHHGEAENHGSERVTDRLYPDQQADRQRESTGLGMGF